MDDGQDMLALRRIVRQAIKFTPENEPRFADEFIEMIDENIADLEEKTKDFTFLSKYGLKQTLAERVSTITRESSCQTRGPAASIASNAERPLLEDNTNYPPETQGEAIAAVDNTQKVVDQSVYEYPTYTNYPTYKQVEPIVAVDDSQNPPQQETEN